MVQQRIRTSAFIDDNVFRLKSSQPYCCSIKNTKMKKTNIHFVVAILFVSVAVIDASSHNTRHRRQRCKMTIYEVINRGGSSTGNNSNSDENIELDLNNNRQYSANDLNDDETDTYDERNLRSSNTAAGLFRSLFDIADDIKSEVSSGIDMFDSISAVRNSASSTFDNNGGGTSRGGALVKAKSITTTTTKRFSRFFAPFDISQVSPFTSRLLNGDNPPSSSNSQFSTAGTSLSSSSSSTDTSVMYAQNIWLDTWADSMPDGKVADTATLTSSTVVDQDMDVESSQSISAENGISNEIETQSDDEDNIHFTSMQQANEINNKPTIETIQLPDDIDVEVPSATVAVTWDLQQQFRIVRKASAKVTGMHGFVSGKYRSESVLSSSSSSATISDEEAKAQRIRRRLDAIDRAKKNLDRLSNLASSRAKKQFFVWGVPTEKRGFLSNDSDNTDSMTKHNERDVRSSEELEVERKRLERVREIDRQILLGQQQLFDLISEKDVLQHRPNPLWNYTAVEADNINNNNKNRSSSDALAITTRQFNFPPKDMIEDYIDMLFSTGRLTKMNHTQLWQQVPVDDDDDEDVLTMPGLYSSNIRQKTPMSSNVNNGDSSPASGSWFLRYGLGEKIGEAAETNAYKGVCQSVMSILARSISALHNVNLMVFSDIRLTVEQTPILPPKLPGIDGNSNYAQQAIQSAVRRGAKKRKGMKRTKNTRYARDRSFVQLDAIVETFLSQCHIAAPILNWFPIAWQRGLIGNIIILVTSIITDFCDGIEFHILGHRMLFTFNPITEDDMLRGLLSLNDNNKNSNNNNNKNSKHFEVAVHATAIDIARNLKFLDKWHERILGSDTLRLQIATLIARLVLTLVDDVLRGAKISLWANHAGGPRISASLEYQNPISSTTSTSTSSTLSSTSTK